MTKFSSRLCLNFLGDIMLHVETFSAFTENELTTQLNYFLKQIDGNLIKDIKFSSFAFSYEKEIKILYTALIIYYLR